MIKEISCKTDVTLAERSNTDIALKEENVGDDRSQDRGDQKGAG
jgi:hypothetical protein